MCEKIPPLVRVDGNLTKDKMEQASELLVTFFPTLPEVVEAEDVHAQRAPRTMPEISMEVERKLVVANTWIVPGKDGRPEMLW